MAPSTDSFPPRGAIRPAAKPRLRAFTLLEVALIVAIIGMMLVMIIGYLVAPKPKGRLSPVAAPTPIPPTTAPSTPSPKTAATPAPVTPPAASTPVPAAAPTQTIDLSPQAAPLFR